MEMEAGRGAQRVAQIVDEEVTQIEASAHRATHMQAWIALASLMVILATICVGAVVSATRGEDRMAAMEKQLGDIESRMRFQEGGALRLEGKVDRIADKVGAAPGKSAP